MFVVCFHFQAAENSNVKLVAALTRRGDAMAKMIVIYIRKTMISVTKIFVNVCTKNIEISLLILYFFHFTNLIPLYIIYIIFIYEFLVSTTGGRSCIFPFTYNGKTHTRCTTDGGYEPWCGYSVNDKGEMHTGYWDYCKYD